MSFDADDMPKHDAESTAAAPTIDYASALARAMKCVDGSARSAVLANIGAKNYTHSEFLEHDLRVLESTPFEFVPSKDSE